MDLTPVRQRGGRNRYKRRKVAHESAELSALPPRRRAVQEDRVDEVAAPPGSVEDFSTIGRRHVGSSHPSTGHGALKTTSRRRKKRKPPGMSPLESLPNEVLQEIHFLAGNINLPRSSLALSYKLSSDAIFMKFCLLHLQSETHEYDIYNMSEHNSIMGCRFFTLAFFKRYLRKLAAEKMPEWYEDAFWGLVDCLRREYSLGTSTYFSPSTAEAFSLHCMERADMLLTVKHRIPLKLIGPGEWTTERFHFLTAVTILRTGEIDLVGWSMGLYTSIERRKEFMHASQQGLQAAIDQDNIEAFALLLAHRGHDISSALIRATIQKASFQLISYTLSRASQVNPPDFLEEKTWKCLDNAPLSKLERGEVREWLVRAEEGERYFLRVPRPPKQTCYKMYHIS